MSASDDDDDRQISSDAEDDVPVDPFAELTNLQHEQTEALDAAKLALAELNRRTNRQLQQQEEMPDTIKPAHEVLSEILNLVNRAETANTKAKRKMDDLEDEVLSILPREKSYNMPII